VGSDGHLDVAARKVRAVTVADHVAAAHGQDVARARNHFTHHGVDSGAGHAGAGEHGGRVEFARRRRKGAEGSRDRARARRGQRVETGAAGVVRAVDLERGARIGVHGHFTEALGAHVEGTQVDDVRASGLVHAYQRTTYAHVLLLDEV